MRNGRYEGKQPRPIVKTSLQVCDGRMPQSMRSSLDVAHVTQPIELDSPAHSHHGVLTELSNSFKSTLNLNFESHMFAVAFLHTSVKGCQ